jgi:hypothetical protein
MEILKDTKWPSVALQGIILSNITLIGVVGNRPFSLFLLFSAIIILSLFILQSISRRFLIFFPYNQFMNVETPSIDTYILRVLLISSIFCFFIGLIDFSACNQIFGEISRTLISFLKLFLVFSSAFIFFILVPIIWILFLREKTIQHIVDKLKKTDFVRDIPCPEKSCDGKAKHIRKVLSRYSLKDKMGCEKCGLKIEEEKKMIIAYGT